MRSIVTIFLTTFFILVTIVCQAQKTSINKEDLPQIAQKFISDNFSDYNLDYIVKKVKFTTTKYKVKFRESIEIEFDTQGNWKEVDGKKTAIPTKFIPKKIREYITEKFSNAQITKIEKEKSGIIEVKLSNSVELEFNSDGDFLRIDS